MAQVQIVIATEKGKEKNDTYALLISNITYATEETRLDSVQVFCSIIGIKLGIYFLTQVMMGIIFHCQELQLIATLAFLEFMSFELTKKK